MRVGLLQCSGSHPASASFCPTLPQSPPPGTAGPAELKGGTAVGTIVSDMTAGTCTASVAIGTATVDCLVDTTTDPAHPYIIAQLECPQGTIAIRES